MIADFDPRVLQGIELFSNVTSDELRQLLPACEIVSASAGETIFAAGGEDRALYIVLEGTADVDLEPSHARERAVDELLPASVFGESSFFHASPHSATVKARTNVRLLRLHKQPFDELLQQGDVTALRIAANAARILASRLQQADRLIVELLDQIQDEKISAAVRNFRSRMFRSYGEAVRPGMPSG